MEQMTITEALAEIKTIQARIVKKRQNVSRYFARGAMMRDPHEKDGGSAEYIRRERQGIADLQRRVVALRRAIQESNLRTMLAVNGSTKPVSDWLIWRRELAPNEKGFLDQMVSGLNQIRTEGLKKGMRVSAEDTGAEKDIVVNVNEQELGKDVETLETLLGTLDGKLSLANATTTITI